MFEFGLLSNIVGFPDGNVFSFCPTIDLLAISMNRTSIWVFRLNGERIYSINNKVLILHHEWSPNGNFFALTGIDKSCKIYDTNNGSLVREFILDSGIEWLNWNEQESIHSKELFMIDVLGNLPKQDDFPNDDNLEYILVSSKTDWGLIFNKLLKVKFSKQDQVLQSLSCSIFNHFFLIKEEDKVLIINIKSNYDPSIITILKTICKLQLTFNNVTNSIQSLLTDLPEFFKLLDRYLSNYHEIIKEGLGNGLSDDSEKAAANRIIKSFSLILSTDLIPQPFSDYWLNQFGDRARKRLHKLGNHIYDSIRNILFKNIITSIEKLIILLTELHSIVIFHKTDQDLEYGISADSINDLITCLKGYLKLIYKLIWECNKEQELFNEFITWCKYVIDLLTKEKNDESLTINMTFDYNKVMDYFYQNMCHSKLFEYLEVGISELEIIQIPSSQPHSIHSCLEQVAAKFGSIFQCFELHFLQSFEETNCKDIPDFEYDKLLNFSKDGDMALIYYRKENSLKLMKFNISSPSEVIFGEINLPVGTIDYKISSDQIVLLVHQPEADYLQLHSIEEIISGNQIPISRQIISNQNAKHLFLNQNRKYGCLLDSNRKDYTIFTL